MTTYKVGTVYPKLSPNLKPHHYVLHAYMWKQQMYRCDTLLVVLGLVMVLVSHVSLCTICIHLLFPHVCIWNMGMALDSVMVLGIPTSI